MSFLSTRRRTGTLLFAALVNPLTGLFWRVTGGAGNWAAYNPATSLPAEFTFAFSESPAGSGRLAIASPPTGFTNTANVPAGMSVVVWLIQVATGVPTNAQITAGGETHVRRWDTATQRLVDPADYQANQARIEAAAASTQSGLAAGLATELRDRLFTASLALYVTDPGSGPLTVYIDSIISGTYGSPAELLGGILSRSGTVQQWRIVTATHDINLGADTLTAEPIDHAEELLADVGVGNDLWSLTSSAAPSSSDAEALQRIGASVGAFGGVQSRDGQTEVEDMNRQDGGTLTRRTTPVGATLELEVTNEAPS